MLFCRTPLHEIVLAHKANQFAVVIPRCAIAHLRACEARAMMCNCTQATAALTVHYAERIDRVDRTPIATVEGMLGMTAGTLSRRMGGGAPRRGD